MPKCLREAGAGSSNLLTPTNNINHLARVSGSEIQLSTPCKSTVSPSQVHHLDHSPKVYRAFAIRQFPQTWEPAMASLYVFTCLGRTRHCHRPHQWVMTVCDHKHQSGTAKCLGHALIRFWCIGVLCVFGLLQKRLRQDDVEISEDRQIACYSFLYRLLYAVIARNE